MTGRSHEREKTSPFTIRLTGAERADLERRAGSLALGTYIKGALFHDGGTRRRVAPRSPLKDQTALAEMLAALGSSRIAEHLAAMAYDMRNGISPADRDTADKLDAACRDVLMMRLLLLRALGVHVDGGDEDGALDARFNTVSDIEASER